MIGVWRERSRPRIIFAVSKPSMPGMRTSSRITAKSFLSASLSASSPDCATIRSWSSAASSSCSANRLFGSSSTMRIFALGAASTGSCAGGAASTVRCAVASSVTWDKRVLSAYELVEHRVVHERGVAGEAELAQDARAVGAHGRGRQAHLLGDLADLLARREQPHDAVLAVGEL